MLMDNKIHIRLNVSCLLQSTQHIRLALSDIMIHDVTQKFRPLNSRSEKRTLKILISAVRAGAILPRKVTVITGLDHVKLVPYFHESVKCDAIQ